jgi:hypothetical protein
MDLHLQGQSIGRESFEYAVSLKTDAGFELQIETPLSVETSVGKNVEVVEITPERPDLQGGHLLALLHKEIESSTVEDSGALVLVFVNGVRLRVEPSEHYESWTLTGARGEKYVCMPGGEVARWPAVGGPGPEHFADAEVGGGDEMDTYAGIQAKWDSAADTVKQILASVHQALGSTAGSVKDMRGQVRSALQSS